MSAGTATATPMVRTKDGAVLGVDWRRTELSPLTVPGRIPARAVMPGDTVDVEGGRYVVLRKRDVRGVLMIVTESVDGASVVFERQGADVVHVVAVGAWDR